MDASTAPWWGVPVVAGIFLVVGAVLAFVFNWIQEARKTKREKRDRYLDKRLEFCSILLKEGNAVMDLLRTTSWPVGGSLSPAAKEAREGMKDSSDRALSAYSSLLLIAPESLLASVRGLVVPMIFTRVIDTADRARSTTEKLQKALRQFEAAGRKHFGVYEREKPKSKRESSEQKEAKSPLQRRLAWLNEPF